MNPTCFPSEIPTAAPSARPHRVRLDIPGVWSIGSANLGSTDASPSAAWEATRVWSTGLPALDAALPGGGWPCGGMVEWLARELGTLEPRLLAMALRGAGAPADWVCVLPAGTKSGVASGAMLAATSDARPGVTQAAMAGTLGLPCPQGWAAAGLRLERTLFIHPATEADGAWAAEQALRSRAAQGVLWFSREASLVVLRRLHWAATEAGVPLIAARPWARQADPSPALLRLSLEPLPEQQLRVRVLKRRGPALERPLELWVPSLPAGLRRGSGVAAAGVPAGLSPTFVTAKAGTEPGVRTAEPSAAAVGTGQTPPPAPVRPPAPVPPVPLLAASLAE